MAQSKPFHNVTRQLVDGSYRNSGNGNYVRHPRFTRDGQNYLRSFMLIQEDLFEIFEYLEPTQRNLKSYSLRNFSILLRICTELEANFKEILTVNTYHPKDWSKLTMRDYRKIEVSHFLSKYDAKLPKLQSSLASRKPFEAWASGGSLAWYQDYNVVKHDRTKFLHLASLDNVISAYLGLAIIIAAQFNCYDWDTVDYIVSSTGDIDGFEPLMSGASPLVKFPEIPEEDRYDFYWPLLASQKRPFARFNYDSVD